MMLIVYATNNLFFVIFIETPFICFLMIFLKIQNSLDITTSHQNNKILTIYLNNFTYLYN